MKNVIIVFLFMLLGAGIASSQEKKGPKLKWNIEKHDLGTIYLDDMPDSKMDIKFTNDGTEPLILSGVRGCCGTRIQNWPREPIMPGQEGVIKIEFRITPVVQRVNRTITAISNADPNTSVFKIEGQVVQR
jgi:hypothetical protein